MTAPLTLMALWNQHRHTCRDIGAIVADAREGKLPGVVQHRFGFDVVDENAALAAMRKDAA